MSAGTSRAASRNQRVTFVSPSVRCQRLIPHLTPRLTARYHTGNPRFETKRDDERTRGGCAAPPLRLVGVSERTATARRTKAPVDHAGDAYQVAVLFLELLRQRDEHAEANLDTWARELAPLISVRGRAEVEA